MKKFAYKNFYKNKYVIVLNLIKEYIIKCIIMNNLIIDLSPYMLYSKQYNEINNNVQASKHNIKRVTANNKENLFWTFYTILNKDKFIDDKHLFKIENDFKINSIIKVQKDKSILKPYKINKKTNGILNLQEKTLSISGLHILCAIYKINIIYIFHNLYYEILVHDGPIHILDHNNNIIHNITLNQVQNK